MKVGLSLSRCLKDIYTGKVEENDVLVIISRTDVNPHNDEHWKQLWDGYFYGGGWSETEWSSLKESDEEHMRRLLCEMYDDGKFHQPRQFGAHPARMPYYWLECVVPEDELSSNPTALHAWEKYKMLAGLTQ
jgi:hypothetical protein